MKISMCFTKNTKNEKQQRQLLKVDRSFKTKTEVTKRTLALSEAFGLGIDEEKTFTIFKEFELDLKPGQVVLITGDSGSGKSTLLTEISSQVSSFGEKEFPDGVISNSTLSVDPNELLIEGVGKDTGDAISILSMAGLNEAFLMLRKFKELSDGQKYRYRLAKMISCSKDVWCFDEFSAILDRVTAKVVSYCIQKTARKLGKTVVVATAQDDIVEDLKPDVWIKKRFGSEVSVQHFKKEWPRECSLLSAVNISSASREEVEPLDQFHYRGSNGGIVRFRFKAEIWGELAGYISYVFPHTHLRGRNVVLPEFQGKTTRELMKRLNSKVVRISRVIVNPKFRSIGLGAHLVKSTMPLTKMKYVETLAVMAKYNPFFESAGMKRVDLPKDESFERDLEDLEKLGFRRELLASKRENMKVLSRLSERELCRVSRFALQNCVAAKFKKVKLIPLVRSLDLDSLAEALKSVKSNAVYLFWENTDVK